MIYGVLAVDCAPINVTNSVTNVTGLTEDTVTVVCDDGYAASGSATFVATCTADDDAATSSWVYADTCVGTVLLTCCSS